MNYIDSNKPNIVSAKEEHYIKMRYIIKKKLNGRSFTEKNPFSNIKTVQIVNGIHSSVKKYLNNEINLRTVLVGKPDELDEIKNIFNTSKQIATIQKILNYDGWVDYSEKSTFHFYNAYDLAEILDIPTCPYCNRMYTKTVSLKGKRNEKITRPTFDHWFPKSVYPLLSLSFYNLIPSCTICNSSIKGATAFELDFHFHPYYQHSDSSKSLDFSFSYDYKDYSRFKFKILTKNKFSRNSVNAFKLKEVYESHEDEITDLRKLRDTYSITYLEILKKNILKGTNISEKEIYRLAFGTHIDEDKFDRRPLSKMKKDILKELGIIK